MAVPAIIVPGENRIPTLTWNTGGPAQKAGSMHIHEPSESRTKPLMNFSMGTPREGVCALLLRRASHVRDPEPF